MNFEKKSGLFRSGAGVIAALVVIVLFILTAMYLKSLIFGIIAAYFFLPLEKFFERRVFRTAAAKKLDGILHKLFSPLTALRNRLSRMEQPTEEELRKKQRDSIVFRSTAAMFATLALALILLVTLSVHLILPAAIRAGQAVNTWASESETLKEAEQKFSSWMEARTSRTAGKTAPQQTGTAEPAGMKEGSNVKTADAGTVDAGTVDAGKTAEETENAETLGEEAVMGMDEGTGGGDFLRDFLTRLRPLVRAYIAENRSDIALFAFSKGKGILGGAMEVASRVGAFTLDLLLFLFFFFFFVLKMASFGPEERKSDPGDWCVQAIFSTPWMPETSENSRKEASEIINSISRMFNRWVRGYISIILIESALYTLLFSVFSVPYALPLGVLAGLTILLPFIGPLASFAATFTVCLTFCEGHLLMTLIGVGATYLLINAVLEQLFLYPTLVGGAIGLTTLETIIVVLLGGLIGGVTGMILAVPAAAILKYLIPKIYRIRFS